MLGPDHTRTTLHLFALQDAHFGASYHVRASNDLGVTHATVVLRRRTGAAQTGQDGGGVAYSRAHGDKGPGGWGEVC